MTTSGPAPLELPPLSSAFRREFQRLFVSLKARGLHVAHKIDRRVAAGELTYRDVFNVMADASEAAERATQACNAIAEKKAPAKHCLKPASQDFCVPNTAEHPLRAMLAFQREVHPEEHAAGIWPMRDAAGFEEWHAARAADFPVDRPRATPASSDTSDLAAKMATLEKKLEDKVGTMRQILQVIASEMEEVEQPAKRTRT